MNNLPRDVQDRIIDLNQAWESYTTARTKDGARMNSDEMISLEQSIIARKIYLIHALTKEIL